VQAELDREREARRSAELEAAKARMSHQLVLNECSQLRQEVERQRQQLELARLDSPPMEIFLHCSIRLKKLVFFRKLNALGFIRSSFYA